jgi:hypothetical protein
MNLFIQCYHLYAYRIAFLPSLAKSCQALPGPSIIWSFLVISSLLVFTSLFSSFLIFPKGRS